MSGELFVPSYPAVHWAGSEQSLTLPEHWGLGELLVVSPLLSSRQSGWYFLPPMVPDDSYVDIDEVVT